MLHNERQIGDDQMKLDKYLFIIIIKREFSPLNVRELYIWVVLDCKLQLDKIHMLL